MLCAWHVKQISAQAQQAFPYQAVARDLSGNTLNNQSISIRFSIPDGSNVGPIIYSESHLTTTNSLGLFQLNIGQGAVITGNFTSIAWSGGSKFLQVEYDPAGGNTYTAMGTTQLLSVPYALYANSSGSAGNGLPNGTEISKGTKIELTF